MSNPMFSFWRCCLKGETNPKLKKKSVHSKGQNGAVEVAQEANPEDVTAQNNDLEYTKSEEPAGASTTNDDLDGSGFESGYENSEVDSSMAASEPDSSIVVPSTIQIVPKGSAAPNSADIGAGGRLHLSFNLQKEANKLSVKIQKIEFAAHQQWKQQDLEVSCMLLPIHKQSFRRRAQRFGEVITIQLPPIGKLAGSALRFRIYDHKTITKKYLIGQGVVQLDDLKLGDSDVGIVLDMSLPNTYGIDTRYISGVKQAQDPLAEESKPEILISLEYRALTRKLVAEVVKTRNLGLWNGSKPQDLCVQLKLRDKDRVLRICRTAVKRHVIDIENNEMFMFRLSHERLADVSLHFTVCRVSDVRKKEDIIGECAFGGSATGHEQADHWDNMLRGEGKVEYRWHTLHK